MRTVENDVPEVLLDLAREAMGLGFSGVHLGFWYLDAEFVSPTEWSLLLIKRESASAERESVTLTVDRGPEDREPRAYIASPSRNPMEGSYWGPDEVRSWMQEPLEAEGEHVPAWAPEGDPGYQARFLALWDLFELGVRSGWTMEHRVGWDSFHSLRNFLKQGDPVPFPSLSLSWSITNSFYNREGHPDHRDTGAELSVRGWRTLSESRDEIFEHSRDSATGNPERRRLTEDELRDRLAVNHPWFVRVALNDEEEDRWLHFPEALYGPEETAVDWPKKRG